MSIGMIGLLLLGSMIGAGVIQHYLGKKNVSKGKGLIIPMGYFLFRILLSVAGGGNYLSTKLLTGVLISYIYYAIFNSAKKKAMENMVDAKQGSIKEMES